ncbi:hypothetical protein BG000_009266 [Podila horticola]|nr:hypothetical protein BG000_009266 [Podila horticola]
MTQSRTLSATVAANSNTATSNSTNLRLNKRKIFLHPLTGSPLKICITRLTPDREDLKTLIHIHGGNVTEHEKMAYIRLAPPGYRYAEQLYSTDWVRDCITKGHLIALHEATKYKLKLAHKLDKTPFTVDDDKLLKRFVAEKTAAGAKINGKKMYQELADAHPRHSMESWRTRAVKVLRLTENPSPYAASKALRDQIPTGMMVAHPFLPSSPRPREHVTTVSQSMSTPHVTTRSPAGTTQKGNSPQSTSPSPSPAPAPRSPGQPSLAPALGLVEPTVVLSADLAPAIATSDPTLTLPSTALTEPDDIMIAQEILRRMAPVSPEIQEERVEDMDLEPPAGQIFPEGHRDLETELFPESESSSAERRELENELFPEAKSSSGYFRELEDELFAEGRSSSEVQSLETREMLENHSLRESDMPLGYDSPPQDDSWLEEPGLPEDQKLLQPSPSSESWILPSKSSASFEIEHNMDRRSPELSQDSSYSAAEVQLPEKFFTSHLRVKRPRIPGRPKNIKYGSQSVASATTRMLTESTASSPGLYRDKTGSSEHALPPTETSLDRNPRDAGSEDKAVKVAHIKEEAPDDLGTVILGTPDDAELQSDDDVGDLSDDDAYVASRILSRQQRPVPRVSLSIASETQHDSEADEISMDRESLGLSQASIKQESQTWIKQVSQEARISSSDEAEQHDDEEEEDEPLVRRRPTMAEVSSAPTAPLLTLPAASTDVESEPQLPHQADPTTQTTTAQQPQIELESHSTSTSALEAEVGSQPTAPVAHGSQVEQETRPTPQPSPRAKPQPAKPDAATPSIQQESENSRTQLDTAKESGAPQRPPELRDEEPEGSRSQSASQDPNSAEPEAPLPKRIQTPQPEATIPKTTARAPKVLEAKEIRQVVPEEAMITRGVVIELPQRKVTRPKSSTPQESPDQLRTDPKPRPAEVLAILDGALTLPKRTPQKMTAAEKFYKGRAEMAKSQFNEQDGSGEQDAQGLTQEQLVEYIRFRYKEDIHKLCVIGLLKGIQAVDVLDACSGDYATAKKLVRKGMTVDIQSKFWTGVDDSILLSGDDSRLDELRNKYSLKEIVGRTEYLSRSRKDAEHYFGIVSSSSTMLTPLKRPAPESRSASLMTDDVGGQSPLKRFSAKGAGSLYRILESKRQRLDED